ncbi:glycosyltransferase family 4 protein [Serinicoccus marinus]|uniref:glycosyltransferase family 4 protein n=1 Tax=Serinicoccus marinus TaxID=247333 RepID=UPI000414E81D|nr:glycosyltransferase family 4 protein [Serinicoccus marinus]
MRVLVVTTWWPTSSSPATGVFVARDVAALATRHDVRVLHLVAPGLAGGPNARPDSELAGMVLTESVVPVEQLVMGVKRPDHVLRAARRVRELSRGADLLHTMAISSLLPLAGWRPSVPWVHTEHWSGLLAPETLTPALRVARRAVRPLLARPDVVAVVGEELAAGMRRLRSGPVEVVPNIVTAPAELAPRRRPDADLAGRGVLEIVGVGGLIPRKDPVRAVETVAALRTRGIAARLTWIGEGPLRGEVELRADALSVPVRLPGGVPPEEVPGLLGESDVFLLPTRAETFCLAAAEALAAGRPVVVGDTGGPREFVGPPSGALVRPGAAPEAWADAVEQVWRDSRGLSAEEISGPVARRYGPEGYAQRVDGIYRRLVGKGGAVAGRGSGEGPPADVTREQPLVDLVIALHSADRQVGRAVRSVLDGSPGLDVRVSVVAHNLALKDARAALGDLADDSRVRVLELADGIPSPSGPFTLGLDAATAPWTAIMGSDDTLAPGALAGWLAAADGLDPQTPVVVVPPLRLAGRRVPTPPVRPVRRLRPGGLDLARDRLSYRSAPLGLLSHGALALPGARLLPGAFVGGDVPMVTALWSQAEVRYAAAAPAYEIHEDAGDRVTYDPRPMVQQLASVDALWDLPVGQQLTATQRRAVATKVLRIHVFGAILTRADPTWWTPAEREELARVTRRVLTEAPGCADPLSVADHDLLAAILDVSVSADRMLELARARRRHGHPRTLLPSSWRHALHREAPLRFMAASLIASHR